MSRSGNRESSKNASLIVRAARSAGFSVSGGLDEGVVAGGWDCCVVVRLCDRLEEGRAAGDRPKGVLEEAEKDGGGMGVFGAGV